MNCGQDRKIALSAMLTAEEVARVLRVSNSTVYRWVHEGTLPGVRIGHTVRFRREDALRLLAGPEVAAVPGRTSLLERNVSPERQRRWEAARGSATGPGGGSMRGYAVEEDPGFLTLTCERGGLRLIFSATGADPAEILAEASTHAATHRRSQRGREETFGEGRLR